MKTIYMGQKEPVLDAVFDAHFENTEDVLKYVRREYKAGTTTFYFETPTNEVLNELKTLHDSGKMRYLQLGVHHSDGDYDFAKNNPKWVKIYR